MQDAVHEVAASQVKQFIVQVRSNYKCVWMCVCWGEASVSGKFDESQGW